MNLAVIKQDHLRYATVLIKLWGPSEMRFIKLGGPIGMGPVVTGEENIGLNVLLASLATNGVGKLSLRKRWGKEE